MTTLSESVIEKIQELGPEDLQKVLRFVETLPSGPPGKSRRSLRGRFAHLGARLSGEDLAEAREEAWANFPRDINLD